MREIWSHLCVCMSVKLKIKVPKDLEVKRQSIIYFNRRKLPIRLVTWFSYVVIRLLNWTGVDGWAFVWRDWLHLKLRTYQLVGSGSFRCDRGSSSGSRKAWRVSDSLLGSNGLLGSLGGGASVTSGNDYGRYALSSDTKRARLCSLDESH